MSNSAERALEVTQERMKTYGHPANVHDKVAKLWSAYLDLELPLAAEDVAMMMVLFKLGREMSQHNEDNLTDMVGYILAFERIIERHQ